MASNFPAGATGFARKQQNPDGTFAVDFMDPQGRVLGTQSVGADFLQSGSPSQQAFNVFATGNSKAQPTAQSTGLVGGRVALPAPAAQFAPAPPDSVEAGISRILSAGSPILDRAQSLARQDANARGLVNSTIATGAGTSAAIDAARSIAAQDADIAAANKRQAADLGAAASRQAADIAAQTTQAQAQRDFSAGQTALDRAFTQAQTAANQQFSDTQRQATQQFQTELAKLNFSQSQISGAQSGLANLLTGIEARRTNDLRTIETDPNTDAAAKQSQIAALNSRFDAELSAAKQTITSIYRVSLDDLYPGVNAPAPTTAAAPAQAPTVAPAATVNDGRQFIPTTPSAVR